jgi:son of sevenless-like protein
MCASGQDAIALLSAFLSLLASIHVARHVDIDGISQSPGQSPTSDLYAQTVDKARSLVRTLEAATQALYDDGSTLLLVIQSFQSSQSSQQVHGVGSVNENLKSLAAALRFNLRVVQKTLEELLSVGHDQADMAQGDYNGSIEWRMSRLSTIDNQFGGALRPTSKYLQKPNDSDGEDVVDIELAFRAPDFKNQDNGDVSQGLESTSNSQYKLEDHARSFDSVKSTLITPEPLDSSFEPTPEPDAGPLFDDEGAYSFVVVPGPALNICDSPGVFCSAGS